MAVPLCAFYASQLLYLLICIARFQCNPEQNGRSMGSEGCHSAEDCMAHRSELQNLLADVAGSQAISHSQDFCVDLE